MTCITVPEEIDGTWLNAKAIGERYHYCPNYVRRLVRLGGIRYKPSSSKDGDLLCLDDLLAKYPHIVKHKPVKHHTVKAKPEPEQKITLPYNSITARWKLIRGNYTKSQLEGIWRAIQEHGGDISHLVECLLPASLMDALIEAGLYEPSEKLLPPMICETREVSVASSAGSLSLCSWGVR